MSDTTLQTAPPLAPEGHGTTSGTASGGPGSFVARHLWWLVGLGLVALSGLLILIVDTRPGYDPYGWLDWGHQTLRLSLDLGGAPSWKPFTYLFNVPYALFGHYALWLWMLTAVSVSVAGAIFGGRIAYRLTAAEATADAANAANAAKAGTEGAAGRRPYAAIVAAVFAGAAVLGIQDYFHYVLSVQSDPMLVTVCLAAIDCHLNGRHRWAWWLLALASLGRPEVWPFAGLYAIWAWLKIPSMRWMLYAGTIIGAFLWFGIPEITNHRPNIAGELALKSPRKCTSNKLVCTVDRFVALDYLPILLAALVSVALAALRRNRVVLMLAASVLLWVAVETAFALHGFPGVPRYLFEPAALTAGLAGVAVGWLLLDASQIHRALPSWAGMPLVVILIGTLIPGAISQIRTERKDVFHERLRTKEINRLSATIDSLGGYKRVVACGRPVVNVEYVSIMAWYTKRNTGTIGYRPKIELGKKYPIVLFTALPNGWRVRPYRSPRRLGGTCAQLRALYVPTAHHPQGVLVRR